MFILLNAKALFVHDSEVVLGTCVTLLSGLAIPKKSFRIVPNNSFSGPETIADPGLDLGIIDRHLLVRYRFTVGKIAPELEAYTLGFPVEKKTYFAPAANWMEDGFDQLSISGAGIFDGVDDAGRDLYGF